MSSKQQTIGAAFEFSGKGLHTGAPSKVTIAPAEAETGIQFQVGDARFSASPFHADGSRHRTVLQYGELEIHTVEHLLAALWGGGVDNALITVEGGEVPGLDGSAKAFCDRLDEVGLIEQDAPRKTFTLKTPVSASFGASSIQAFPSKDDKFRVTYILDYPESSLAQGTVEFEISPETIRKELSPCRTFVMKCHAEKLLEAGLGQGANTENTVVLDGDQVVDNELRFDDECPRHKVLDVIGDLATVGVRMGIHVIAYKSGHALNLELAQALVRMIQHEEQPRGLLDIQEIEKWLPHRYPFLLVDRVVEMEERKRIRTFKNLTRNEDFFNGHFPGQPIMPGVLQVEALAQSGGVLLMREKECRGKLAVLMGVEDVKFRRPVVPGDRLYMDVEIVKIKGRIGIVQARASVDGDTTTECNIKFALVDPDQYT